MNPPTGRALRMLWPLNGRDGRMPFCLAFTVREMRMTPAESLWTATVGGAAALRRTDVGRLTLGARADLVLLYAPSYLHLAYRPGVNLVAGVWRDGARATEWATWSDR